MSEHPPIRSEPAWPETLRLLERRLARLEQHLRLPPVDEGPTASVTTPVPPASPILAPAVAAESAEELEYLVGQRWFAGVGVLVLTCGVGFALSLPLAGLPPAAPALIGGAAAVAALLAARLARKPFELVAGHLRAAGMALSFFAALRLFYFGGTPVLALDSAAGGAVLAAAVGFNLVFALRRRSPWLLGLAMMMGLLAALVVGTPAVVFGAVTILAALGAAVAVRRQLPVLLLATALAAYLTHLTWAINRPWSGRAFKLMADDPVALVFLLLYVVILAAGSLQRRERTADDPVTILIGLVNCGLGYGLMLLESLGLSALPFAAMHLAATLVYLGLAAAYWRRESSRIATFIHAMTGYLALTAAIVKLFPPPEVFIWLSGQSLVVVATALWFRSRLIVVGNFFIFAAIVLAYMAVAKAESGISLGFGVVALLTARILNWQKERLELKTELMRNAYLASAFVVFPYALYHIVPGAWVSVSWIGVALAYYAMNLVVRNPKYRWMGHLTLLLTALHLVVVGVTHLAPAHRILSFLALGTVLVVVSVIFTLVRSKRTRKPVEK
ncbi:MAG TPA: hypothetical protein VG936_02120 [Lacunisphaera sp.]|nr:hypothetical protein [Lacunisphaera sp.]